MRSKKDKLMVPQEITEERLVKMLEENGRAGQELASRVKGMEADEYTDRVHKKLNLEVAALNSSSRSAIGATVRQVFLAKVLLLGAPKELPEGS